MAFEFDFVVCRLESAQDLAKTFAKWQSVISAPNLDRKFATTLTVTPVGIVIAGAIFFAAVLVKSQLFIYFFFTQVLTSVLAPNMMPSTLKLNWVLDL